MIKINEKLTVLHDNNSVFSDFSNELVGFDRDSASFTFVTAEDSIYVGFYKPINVFYTEFTTANTNAATLTVKYYNGTTFTACAGLHDDTDGLTRSAFVKWDRNQTTEATTTINSTVLFWYKIDLSVDSSSMVIAGLNLVFSDDQDLKREIYEISKYLPSGVSTHILSHVSARDEIIQNLNIIGKSKVDGTSGWVEGITSFDLLDISEVKLASTYLALSKIMFAASDEVDDTYSFKAQKYENLAKNIVNNIRIKTDSDDDGLDDESENTTSLSGTIRRL
jgi:hypothetical protein